MTNLINKKLSLNILSHDFNELASELESKLELLTKHILFDQNKNTLKVNLKLISSKEMMKLNEEFREKRIDTNVLSFETAASFACSVSSMFFSSVLIMRLLLLICFLVTTMLPIQFFCQNVTAQN